MKLHSEHIIRRSHQSICTTKLILMKFIIVSWSLLGCITVTWSSNNTLWSAF